MNAQILPSVSDKAPLVPISLPKAEMHVHIALALSPELFLRRIKQGRTTIRPRFLLDRDRRYYPELVDHHAVYEAMRHITSTPNELAQVTQNYLERIAREGAIYAEISNSFRDPKLFESQMDAIEEAIRCARHNTGIEARIVVTSIRNMGAAHALKAAKHLSKHRRALVTGFGLAGEENLDALMAYKQAFHVAWHEAGLGLAPHVAEQHLHNAIDFLDAVPAEALRISTGDHRRLRAGHAALIHASSSLMQRFKYYNVGIEMEISANKRINIPAETRALRLGSVVTSKTGKSITLDRPLRHYFRDVTAHPLKEYMDFGLAVCLGSDNPLLQNTNIGKEYSLAVKAGITDMEAVLDLTANAIRYANVDSVTRLALMQKVDLYRAQMRSGQLPEGTANGYLQSFSNV